MINNTKMSNGATVLVNLLTLILSLIAIFYAIWVHQTVYNMFIPKLFSLPVLTYFQAFIIGLVGSTFFRNTTVSLVESFIKKDLSKDEKSLFDLMRVLYVIGGATMELAVAWIVMKVAL